MNNELKHIRLDQIELGERFRKEYDVEDLKLSITEHGVFQPITVIPGEQTDTFKLAAGGRRYTACTELELATIPCLIRESGDELDLREIEFLENNQREDLPWQDRVLQTKGLHELMREKHGDKWGQRGTAKLLDKSVGGVNRHLQLADMMEEFPIIQKIPNEDGAVKFVRKILEKAVVKKMAADQEVFEDSEEEEERFREDPYLAKSKHASSHFRIQDCFEGMREIIDDPDMNPPIALIEVDPPYGINLKEQKKGDADFALKKYEEIDSEDYEVWTQILCGHLYDVAPENTTVIYWFAIEHYSLVKFALEDSGFKVDTIPCIWAKESGQTNAPDLYLARCWEPFFVAYKGKGTPLQQRGRSNIFSFPAVPPKQKYHPTQRPLDLIREILRTFSWENTIVLVPFLGSGTTLRAVYLENMNGFGFELNEHNKEPFLAAVQGDIKEYKDGYSEPDPEIEDDEGYEDDIPF